MIAVLISGLIAVALAATLTPFVCRVAKNLGALDEPGGRHVHITATPRLGGVAIVCAYMAAIAGCVSSGLLKHAVWDWRALWAFLLGGLLIAATGFVDDIWSVRPLKKLAVQCLAASMGWAGGVGVLSSVSLPGIGEVYIGPVLSYLLTVIWVVAFINAINLIDGLDGLAGGVVFFATLTNIIVALVTGNVLAGVLNAALAGAVLGFLFYNFNPAKIFMGDTGSMFLGYALGSSAVMTSGQKESTLASLLVPVLALGLPLTDTLLAMVRRMVARQPIFVGDRGHFHHRLLDLGLTHRRAVLVLYGCTIVLCTAAIAAALGRDWQVGAAVVGALLTLLGITRFAGYFQVFLTRQDRRARFEATAEAVRRAIPEVVVELDRAPTPAAVWAAFERTLARCAFLLSAKYQPGRGERPSWTWERAGSSERPVVALAECVFKIRPFPGASPGLLKVSCSTDGGQLPAPTEMLLQVIVDAVESALVRVHVRSPAALVRPVSPAGSG